MHTVVARSTFGSEHVTCNVQNTMLRSLLEVEMLENFTPLWREVHFQVKMYKTHQLLTTFRSGDVEKNRTLLRRKAHFKSKNNMVKSPHIRATF